VSAERKTIGWREWVRLPGLGDAVVKAKVDTGARTSTLHAYDIDELERDGEPWISFRFELRYVVETEVVVDGEPIPIELTLSRRDAMGFRMLLGRRALRGRFVVDPRRSYRTAESKNVRKRAKKERASR
jgi:hypothetical protein